MAYVFDTALTFLNGAVTAGAMTMPSYAVNDLLIMYVTMDSGSATITTGTGWATIANETTNAAVTASWSWKVATGTGDAVSITTTDAYCCTIFCIKDAATTTPIDASNLSGINVATSTPVNLSVTTTTADCLVLYALAMDGIATAAHSNPGVHHIISYDNQGTTATTAATAHAAWYFQRTAGATPAAGWTASASGVYTRLTVAIKNKSGGRIPAYIDDVSSPATVVTPGHHIGTLNNIAFAGAYTVQGSINGKTVGTLAAAAAQADLGINPFSNAISKAAGYLAATSLSGFEITLTGGRNWSTGLLMGSFIGATPKMGTFGMGSVSEGGCVVRIGSSATAWCAYQVAAKDAVPTLENRSVWAIQPGYTGSSYGTPGTAVTTTAVTYLQVLTNQPGTSTFNANAVLSEVYQVFPQIVAGGDATFPVDSDGLTQIGKSFRLPVIQKSGGYGLLSYAPIQIGGGDAVNFQIDAGALQFPRRYNTITKEIGFHAADSAVGISYAGKSGDVIKHTNSVITSPTRYYWNINASATSAATWDFSGLVVVNADITFRPVMTFTDMSFSGSSVIATNASSLNGCVFTGCTEITAAGITLTDCTISKTTSSTGAISITGSTQTALQTELTKLSSTTFSSNTTGPALRIIYTGSAGAISLSLVNAVFSGNTVDIRWEAPAGSNLTINKSGTTNAATYTATNSNTVTFNASYTLTITGVVSGSDVVINTTGTTTNLYTNDGATNPVTSVPYTYSTTQNVDIYVYKVGYVPYSIKNYALTTSNASLPVAQVSDRNYTS